MLPQETRLEVRSRLPAQSAGKPPLLFIHGGYCDGWCWEPYFLPWFAARGYAAYALSLRGHGASGGRDTLFVAGLDDYVADVEHVAGGLESPPVLIGHSMGAAVVERLMATRPVRAAALLAPIPPGGLAPVASRLLIWQPEYLVNMQRLDAPHLSGDMLAALRPMYFSEDVAPEMLLEAVAHLTVESPRALLDLTLRLHDGRPVATEPLLVVGASADRISTPGDVRATASLYRVEALIVPGLAHMMMLERSWQMVAQPLLEWLEKDVGAAGSA
ncbi:MAG TPA: alpha/beta fold hydrolase [Casimicrobiaceae bacterium]|nr:alpha/beta fold hydrolase [Casimicrobiaceae bacterium]